MSEIASKKHYMFRQSVFDRKKHTIRTILLCCIGAFITACASIGTPSGGDYDLDPPKVVKVTPEFNATNVQKGRVEIIFDELVQLEKQDEKIIITPPQQNFPNIRAVNNRVVVDLRDTLLANTTYTIDFTDAIVDNNEKNVLENFAISFSTGDVVDSLSVSGKVLTADNLEPVSAMYVGIHSDLSDTAFIKKPFLRISRTNELGKFTIKGIAPGKYRIYALNDINRDYRYNDPGEAIAFLDEVIVPSTEAASRQDSIFDIKHIFDTIKTVHYTRFLPDDIVLRSFTSSFKRQYLQKVERPSDDVLNIFFGSATQMPKIEPLDIPAGIDEWSVLERSAGNDTLKFWITKPAIVQMDSINLKISYYMTDSLNQLQPVSDTLSFVNRRRKQDEKEREKKEKEKEKRKKDGKEEEEKIDFLNIRTDISQAFDVYKNINIEFDRPIIDLQKNQLKLKELVDSTYQDRDFVLSNDTLSPRKYIIQYKWRQGSQYKFEVDSAAIHSYDGRWNNKFESGFKVKTEDQYGIISFYLEGVPDSIPAFIEILDKSDRVIRKAKVSLPKTSVPNLDPGVYYARIVIDNNDNGKWDPGEYTESNKREPEMVYYYSKSIDLKAYWEMEEDWTVNELPLDKQKPLDITKNKPKDNDRKKKELERREANEKRRGNSQNSSNTNSTTNNSNTTNNYNNTYQ